MSAHAIIIPCYNEALRLKIHDFREFLIQNTDIRYCFVDDGSTDNTLSILELIKDNHPEQVYILRLPTNTGKAEAIREGMLYMFRETDIKHLGFLDADLSTALEDYYQLVINSRATNAAIVFGSRKITKSSHIEYPPIRIVTSSIAKRIIHFILKLPIYDTQCGAKVFSGEVIEVCFSRPFITRWVSDVEIFLRLKNHFGKESMAHFNEVNIDTWIFRKRSNIKFMEYILIPYQFLRIYLHYNLK